MPLLEIKDFGPPTTYGEDKELTLNEKITPSPHPSPSRGEGEEYLTPLLTSAIRHAVSLDSTPFRRFS